MRRSLTKKEILTSRKDIGKLFKISFRVHCSGAKLLYSENGFGFSRILVTLVKRYGNSVERNRAKRIMKELYRNEKNCIKPGYDLIFILYPGSTAFEDREKQFHALLSKAGLFK